MSKGNLQAKEHLAGVTFGVPELPSPSPLPLLTKACGNLTLSGLGPQKPTEKRTPTNQLEKGRQPRRKTGKTLVVRYRCEEKHFLTEIRLDRNQLEHAVHCRCVAHCSIINEQLQSIHAALCSIEIKNTQSFQMSTQRSLLHGHLFIS